MHAPPVPGSSPGASGRPSRGGEAAGYRRDPSVMRSSRRDTPRSSPESPASRAALPVDGACRLFFEPERARRPGGGRVAKRRGSVGATASSTCAKYDPPCALHLFEHAGRRGLLGSLPIDARAARRVAARIVARGPEAAPPPRPARRGSRSPSSAAPPRFPSRTRVTAGSRPRTATRHWFASIARRSVLPKRRTVVRAGRTA